MPDPLVALVIRPHIIEAAEEIAQNSKITKSQARAVLKRHFEGLPKDFSDMSTNEDVFEATLKHARKLWSEQNHHKATPP